MDHTAVYMTWLAMVMVGLGMDMDQWRAEHPQGRPEKNYHANPR